MRVRLVIAAAVIVAACGDSSTEPKVTLEIITSGDIFSPTFATLKAGEAARFTFAGGSDGQGHNVRFNPRIAGAPDDINVTKTGSVIRVFTTKGTFKYDCDVHPGMKAEVSVE